MVADPDGIQLVLHRTDEPARAFQRASRRPAGQCYRCGPPTAPGRSSGSTPRGGVIGEPARAAYGGTDGAVADGCGDLLNPHQDSCAAVQPPPTPETVRAGAMRPGADGPGHEDHSVQTTATKPAGAAIALEPRRRRRSEHLEHSLPDEEIEDVTTEDAPGPDDANGFLASERAGAMTATLADDVICGAVLDEQATPGERA